MTAKVTSYFNIFKCGRNVLDQLVVMYQCAFIASPVRERYYIPSPARDRYYDKMEKSLINSNFGSDVTINNDKLNQAITDLKAEAKSGHELKINDMKQVDEYKSPEEKKMRQQSTIQNIIIPMSTKMK